MPRRSETELITRVQRLLNIIWIAFMVGAAIYVVLGVYIVGVGSDGGAGANADASGAAGGAAAPRMPVPLHLIFGVLALTEIGVVLVGPRYLLGEKRLKAAVQRGPTPDILRQAGMKDPDERESSLLALLKQYTTAKITLWAVAESIAIYGLILTIMLKTTMWLYPFAAVGIVLVAVSPPRAEQFLGEHRSLLR